MNTEKRVSRRSKKLSGTIKSGKTIETWLKAGVKRKIWKKGMH